jgi:hypothetical protein
LNNTMMAARARPDPVTAARVNLMVHPYTRKLPF